MKPVSLTATLHELDAQAEQQFLSETTSGGQMSRPSESKTELSVQDRWDGKLPLRYPQLPLTEEERYQQKRERWSARCLWGPVGCSLLMLMMAKQAIGNGFMVGAPIYGSVGLVMSGLLLTVGWALWRLEKPKAYWARMDRRFQADLSRLTTDALIGLAWHKEARPAWKKMIHAELQRRGALK